MTRIQRERFASEEDYQAQKNVFVLDKEKLDKAKEDMIILHPLPRVNEITVDIDDDPRALYFKQAQYGMYGRMALILLLLQDDEFFVETDRLLYRIITATIRDVSHSRSHIFRTSATKSLVW